MPRYFPGNTAYQLFAGSSSVLDITGKFLTLSAWIFGGSYASNGGIIQKYDANGSNQYGLITTSAAKLDFFIDDGSADSVIGSTTLAVQRWYHVAGVFRSSQIEVWLDGRMDVTPTGTTKTLGSSSSIFRIGRLGSAGTQYPFNGFIAHGAIWNEALGPNEIMLLAQGLSPRWVRPTGLKGYWPIGGAGTIERDLVGGNTLTAGTQNEARPMLAGGNVVSFINAPQIWVAEAEEATDVEPPFVTVSAEGFVPDVVGPETLTAPLLTIDVDTFTPTTPLELHPPFMTVGVFAGPVQPGSETPGPAVPVEPVFLSEGALPPFVPPSLPPTLGGGAGPGGGGGVTPPIGPGVPLPPLSSGGLAGIRFYQGPPWRWVVTDLETNTLTFLDRLAMEVTVSYALNKGSTAKLSIPSANPEVNILHTDGDPFVSEGNRLLYGFRREGGTEEGHPELWRVRFAGKILQVEDTGETENARTIITAFDPWHLLYQRPMKNIDNEFPDKAGFFSFDDTQVGVICRVFLRNTIVNDGSGLNDHGDLGIDMGDGPTSDLEPAYGDLPGTPYWDGEYENTTQRDVDCQQGMAVGEVWDQQLETGALDILMTPIYDPVNRPGYMVDLSIFEIAGTERDDAIFAWDKPSRNLVGIDSLRDGTKRANTIRYYSDQGGAASGTGIPQSYGPSIIKYGETWHQQFFPDRIEPVVNALATLQLLLMENGIHTVTMTPSPERMPFLFTEFWLGDTFPVYASSNLRQSIAGFQRLYGVVLSIDENSYEQVPQLLVSPDTA